MPCTFLTSLAILFCSGLESYALHFILRQPFLRPVVELRRPRTFMRCHLLSVLKRSTISEVGGDPGCAEGVIAD